MARMTVGETASTADQTSGDPRWFDKYVTAQHHASGGSLSQLSFAAVKAVPPSDWQAAQAAEQREAAARPGAAAAAVRARYARFAVPTARLNDGHTIPLVGLGTWKAAKGEVRQAVYEALLAGYRVSCLSLAELG